MKNEGYLLVDHRASPGITAEDLKRAGIGRATAARLGIDIESLPEMGEGKLMERATKRCCHCGSQVILRSDRARPRNFCRTCPPGLDYICDRPACHYDCAPYRRKLDKIREDLERAAQIERSVGGVPNFVTIDLPDEPAKEKSNG